ncbi:MAG: sugar-transfer associated ATP-grasp domain-containing protein [Lentimicrobium sp.]|jgi:hypothetical protein|nr:sugar-transfer associated ATP-grasp domain-containing protein [Lentimicrobium sp.]
MAKRSLPAKIKDFFIIILNDPYRKSVPRILWEYGRFIFIKPDVASQYFSKFIYRKGVTNFDDYAMTHKLRDLCWTLNDPDYHSIVDNRYLFELFFKKYNISVTTTYARNQNSLFFIDNDFIQINTPGQFLEFIKEISLKSTKSESIFIKKESGTGGGKFIYKVSYAGLKENSDQLNEIFKVVRASSFVFQETVLQHEAISRINPFCVNTMRIETFTNKDNVSRIMSGILRLGFSDAYLDNVSKGGAYVGVDFTKGVLRREAVSDFTNGRARTYLEHPYSKIKFEDYPIPYFDEIKELVLQASQLVPQLKVIGWDVAITPDGPLLIEANEFPGMMSPDIGQKGIGKSPVFQEMKKEALEKEQSVRRKKS